MYDLFHTCRLSNGMIRFEVRTIQFPNKCIPVIILQFSLCFLCIHALCTTSLGGRNAWRLLDQSLRCSPGRTQWSVMPNRSTQKDNVTLITCLVYNLFRVQLPYDRKRSVLNYLMTVPIHTDDGKFVCCCLSHTKTKPLTQILPSCCVWDIFYRHVQYV